VIADTTVGESPTQDIDMFHDDIRVGMLNHLHDIACANANMWVHEHPTASLMEVAEARLYYFKLVFEPFWDIAKDIKLRLGVGYPADDSYEKGEGVMLQPDVERDMGCFLCAYNEALRV
jgi:hypothetical protein